MRSLQGHGLPSELPTTVERGDIHMRLRFMRGRSLLALALGAALVIPTAVGAASSSPGKQVPAAAPQVAGAATSGESSEIFLVQLEDGAQTFRNQAKSVGLKYTERFAYKRLFNGVAVRIAAGDVGKLAGIGSVANVYPARYYTLGPTSTADPELATAIQMTGADVAQAAGYSGAGVKVAVMDTGHRSRPCRPRRRRRRRRNARQLTSRRAMGLRRGRLQRGSRKPELRPGAQPGSGG